MHDRLPSLARLGAVSRKELRHITRDFRIFFLVTISPAFLLFVLAYVFAFDTGHVGLAWLDYDRTPESRSYLAAMTADGSFELRAVLSSYEEAEAVLLEGAAQIALVVPGGFARNLLAGQGAMVQAIADGTDAMTASQALGSLSARTAAFGAQMARRRIRLPETRTRAFYNGDLKSLWSMVPGLLAIVLTLPALALTLSMGREKETGTLEALLSTPVLGIEYQLGKVAAYVLTGLGSAALAGSVAVLWFGVPFRGNPAVYGLLVLAYLLATMGIALLIARFMASQQTAMLAVLLVFFVPGFFVSGLITPIREGSLTALLTSYALPVTHFIAINRAVFLKGVGLGHLGLHAALLAAMAIASIGLSIGLHKKRIA